MNFLLRAAIVLPVLVVSLLSTTIPRRLGFYRMLMDGEPAGRGAFPAYYPNGEADWAFTFEDLYGIDPAGGSAEDEDEDDDASSSSAAATATATAHRNRLRGQTALVTGANSGTGYEVALALVRLGVRVTLACRNPERCEIAASTIRSDPRVLARQQQQQRQQQSVVVVSTATVDTSSLESVERFCDGFLASEVSASGLDMLFLNAGMPFSAPLEDGTNPMSVDGLELTFATNVIGHHLMYRKLANLLTPKARIVLTSSAASYDVLYDYKVPTDLRQLNDDPIIGQGSSHYARSKLAQIYWAEELTARLGPSGDDAPYVNAGHPGVVATSIWKKNKFPSETVQALFYGIERWVRPILWTAAEGALTLLYLGTAIERLERDNLRGRYFHPQATLVTEHEHVYGDRAAAKILREKLWSFLDELVAERV